MLKLQKLYDYIVYSYNMSETLTVKVHDLLHDEQDFSKKEVEEYIERQTKNRVKNVRISKGHSNSPLFLEVKSGRNTLTRLKKICYKGVLLFSEKVDGVDVNDCIRDDNLRVTNSP